MIRAEADGGRGVGERVLRHWEEKEMFEINQNNLMNQIRMIRKKGWLTNVEIEEIRRKVGSDSNESNDGETNVDMGLESSRSSRQVNDEDIKVNKILQYVKCTGITQVREVLVAASVLVCERVGAKEGTQKRIKEPWWKRRIERLIRSI